MRLPKLNRFAMFGLALSAALTGMSCEARTPAPSEAAADPRLGAVGLSTDEACELLIDRALEDLFGAWANRYNEVVWCNRTQDDEITVTITPANDQPRGGGEELIEQQARTAIESLVARKEWQRRYTKVTVQYLP